METIRDMGQAKPYQARSYDVGRTLLGLREKLALTQAQLGALLGVSRRSVQKWEGGEAYPSAEHLRHLFAVVLTHDGFTRDGERAEAEAVWEQVSADAPRRLGGFDTAWFEQLLAQRAAVPAVQRAAQPPTVAPLPLPAQPAPFLGRDAELAELGRLLADPACRVLTICGPGGIGKTGLALEAAARCGTLFADGAAWVELAAIDAPHQVAATIGEALGVPSNGPADPAERLLRALEPLQLLLVLDTVEHVLDGMDFINALVLRAPRITVLVTSRERLNLRSEWIFDVQGLAYPPDSSLPGTAALSVDQAVSYSAVSLFMHHARRVQPRFSPSAGDLRSLVGICRFLAGMPLAIELAAAWVRTLPIQAIEQHIQANLDLLSTTQRDVPARHRSLRAVFDHSWAMLDQREQQMLARLAVFRGSFTAAASDQVVGATTPELAAFIDKSLLRRVHVLNATPSEPDALRFAMLEPTREYALERLTAHGELPAMQQAHAEYFLAQAEAHAAPDRAPASQPRHLDRDLDNLRAVLRWTLDRGEQAWGLRLAEALWLFWRRRGYLHEGRQWLADLMALEPSGAAVKRAACRPGDAARIWLASDELSFAQTAALFAQGVALQRNLGLPDGLTDVLIGGARRARSEGDYARATALLEQEALKYRARLADGTTQDAAIVPVLQELAMVLREQGQYARAQALWQECLELQRAHDDRVGTAVAYMGLSDVARDTDDRAAVRALCDSSLLLFREIGEERGIGYCLNNLALADLMDGHFDRAATVIEESVTLFRALQGGPSLAEVLVTRGRVNTARGSIQAAGADLSEALQIAYAEGPRWQLAAAMEALGEWFVRRGLEHQALPLLSAATTMRTTMAMPIRDVDRAGYERAVATIRAKFGDLAFERTWTAAASRTLVSVISESLAAATEVADAGTARRMVGD